MVNTNENVLLAEEASTTSSLLLSHVSNNYFTASENSAISYDSSIKTGDVEIILEDTDIEKDANNGYGRVLSTLPHKGKRK